MATKRRGLESLATRLAKRECLGAPPGAVVPQSRRLYENVVPDTVVPGVVPPPNSVLSCFTPSGDYLIAFQPISNEVIAYRFKGLHVSGKSQPQGLAGGGNTNNAAGVGTAAAPLLETSSQPALGSQPASQQQAAFGQQEAAAAAGEEQEQRQVAFSDVFRQHWRCCPCPSRQEQISTDFCLTVHDRFLLVATATPERQPPAGARGAARLVPWVDRTTFHLLDLENGSLLDSHTVRGEYVELARNQGVHLRGHLLLVLGLSSQTLYMLQLLPTGRFLFLQAVGQHCRDDDALVIAQQEERERRFRQQQEQQRSGQQQRAAHSSLPSTGSFPSLLALASEARSAAAAAATAAGSAAQPAGAAATAAGGGGGGGRGGGSAQGRSPASAAAAAAAAPSPASSPAPSQAAAAAAAAAVAAAATAAAAAVAAAATAAAAAAAAAPESVSDAGDDGEEDLEEDEGDDSLSGRVGSLRHGAAASPLITGLKQCLLACLFQEARQQSAAAAADAAGAVSAAAQVPAASHLPWGGSAASPGMPRPCASTGSLPTSQRDVSAALRPPQRMVGSSGNLAAQQRGPSRLSPQQQPRGSVPPDDGCGGGGSSSRLLPHWRRHLDRFYYYFEAHLELLMWKAQLMDDQRLLIHWCPAEMLSGPHRHQLHGNAPSTAAGGQQGSYLMLFNTATASVEQLFVAHSRELAAWYLQHPAAFHGGHSCSCGCGSDWERWVPAPAASCLAREQQLRDPLLAAKELRHRLSDELPASSQTRQVTPYLDPDLYCYDERAIGGAIRPHHPPHRSIKFMCRCQPERLRFRLDPEHLQAAPPVEQATGSRAAAAAAARAHVVYLFHPVQPCLLAVMQDIETAMAERVTLFTRL